jgi:hypothetical protein
MDPDKQAEQRKQVAGAAQSLLGCGGLIALVAGLYWVLGWLPKSVTAGPGVYVFVQQGDTNNWLFWTALVGTISFFVLLGIVKSAPGVFGVVAAFAALVGVVLFTLYGQVAAVAFVGKQVEMRYVWPRPAESLDPREIASVKIEETTDSGPQFGIQNYHLLLQTTRGGYKTFSNTDEPAAREVVRRIDAMRRR